MKNVEAGFYSIKLVALANHYGTLRGGGLKLPKILSTWLVHALLEEKKIYRRQAHFEITSQREGQNELVPPRSVESLVFLGVIHYSNGSFFSTWARGDFLKI